MEKILRLLFYKMQIIREKMIGVDFTAEVESRHENHVKYAGSTSLINGMLRAYFLRMNVGENDSICDVGCGKGKMLYFFSKFPFGQVGGIEYEENLYQICKKNMEKLKVYRIRVHCGDAAKYDEYDEYNYFYLFNPFHKEIMEGFIDRVRSSKQQNDRVIRVIYFNPIDIDLFLTNGFVVEEELQHKISILKL